MPYSYEDILKDHNGKPIRVYRGEHGPVSDGLATQLASYSFCDNAETASVYALHPNRIGDIVVAPRVMPGYLVICNPIFDCPEDPFIDISDLIDKFGLELATHFALKFAGYVEHTNNWEDIILTEFEDIKSVQDLVDRRPELLSRLYLYAFPLLDDPEFIGVARKHGYDGAIHHGNGESFEDIEFRIFSEEQFIPLFSSMASPHTEAVLEDSPIGLAAA